MAVILAIDTSTEACSVALMVNNEIINEATIAKQDHAKQILPMVARVLSQAECGGHAIDAIAFMQGPGSFTGVRIGIGIAQGLAFGFDRPMIAISTLMTLAQGAYRHHGAKQVIAAIDARMAEVYLGHYYRLDNGQWQTGCNEIVINPEAVNSYIQLQPAVQPTYAIGTGWKTYPKMLDLESIYLADFHLPDAQDMLPIAQQKWHNSDVIIVDDVEPIYLRNEVTWKKLPGRE